MGGTTYVYRSIQEAPKENGTQHQHQDKKQQN